MSDPTGDEAPRPPLVVIVAYRSDDHLRLCLEGLDASLDVLVVDNDAADSTREICTPFGASYLPTTANLGFAGAVNLGLARSDGRDVLLLNPDARISPESILNLQRFLRDPTHRRAAVGPELVNAQGSERASWPMPSPRQSWADALGLSSRLRGRRFVTGAVLLLRGEAIAAIGGFDERYFLYAEESDWQQRAQEAGWEVAVDPAVTAHHVGGVSSSDEDRRDYFFITSQRAFAERWYGLAGAFAMRAGAFAAGLRRAAMGPDRLTGRRRLRQSLRLHTPAMSPPRPSVVHVVCTHSFAGVERSVVDLATEQHRRGWRVTIVGGDATRMRAELPPGVLTLSGASVLSAYRSLVRLGRVDVVHVHMTAAEFAGAFAKHRLRAQLAATRHFAAPRGSTPIARSLGRLFAQQIDAEVAISEFVATAVGEPSHVVLNGVQNSSTSVERTKTVVVLQRLEVEKQTNLALRAWTASELPRRGWRMVILGRGRQQGELQKLAHDLGCEESVSFPGFTDQPRAALASASILLATAPGEPFGLTIAEAMAEGTPVVAADGGAHREVAGQDGRYFPPGDFNAAARELDRLAALPELERSRLGDKLRDRQRTLFTIERQVDRLMPHYRDAARRVAMLSLEPWDDVWRRNQHLASRLVRSGVVSSLLFVNPPRGGLALRAVRYQPEPGITVVTPPLIIPRRRGGHRLLGRWLRSATADVDLWWINDPVSGDAARLPGAPAVYDVTDDWRAVEQSDADRRRIVKAEDRLATEAETVVCSRTLATRWRERYGVEATLIGNGVDGSAIRSASTRTLEGAPPHLVYVGTVHANRVDVGLLRRIAERSAGTLHLVGPENLDPATRAFLDQHGVRRHGPVASRDVPAWLVSADVLICPHVVDEFTLSLDAIKAHEYLATRKPIVATPSSGFESMQAPGLTVVPAVGFIEALEAAIGTGPFDRAHPANWDDRAAEFAAVLDRVLSERANPRVAVAASRVHR